MISVNFIDAFSIQVVVFAVCSEWSRCITLAGWSATKAKEVSLHILSSGNSERTSVTISYLIDKNCFAKSNFCHSFLFFLEQPVISYCVAD